MARKSILLVDDSADIRELYQQILESAGYEATTAASGAEALAKAKAERFDLILSDVVMPGMDGLDFVSHLRSDLPPPLPPVILWSGFDITEEEALRRGALMFVRKPVTQDDVLDFVSFGIRGQRIDPAARAQQRMRSTVARKRALAAADELLAHLDLQALRHRVAGQLRWIRSYFGVGTALTVFLQGERLIIMDVDGEAPWQIGADVSAQLVYAFEIIETGASLVLFDASTHPSFATAGGALEGIRFFTGVPLIGPGGVTVGVICLFDAKPRMFQAEDMLILEQLGRRASELIDAFAAGRPTEAGWSTSAGMAIASTFELVLQAELRLLARDGGSLELAVLDLADPVRISEAMAEYPSRQRLCGGILGPSRGALFKREVTRTGGHKLDELLRKLADASIHHVAGIVTVTDPDMARIGPGGLIRIASLALERAQQSNGALQRVVVQSEPGV